MAPGKGRKAPKGKPKGIGIDFKASHCLTTILAARKHASSFVR